MAGKRWLRHCYIVWFCIGLLLVEVAIPALQFQGTRAILKPAILAEETEQGQYPFAQEHHHRFDYDNQGRLSYEQEDYANAILVWQQALARYVQQQDILSQARVLSNLSLAYQKLGHWDAAQRYIASSVDLLSAPDSQSVIVDETARQRGLAQAFNTQGSLQFELGQTQAALATWNQAISLYEAIGNQFSVWRSQLNRVQAMQELGYHRRALADLEHLHQQIQAIASHSKLRLVVLRHLGDVWRLVGDVERSQQILLEGLALAQHIFAEENVHQPSRSSEMAAILLSLGQTKRIQGNLGAAMEYYQQALDAYPDRGLHLYIELAQLQLHINQRQWQAAETLWLQVRIEIESFPPSRNRVHTYINLGRQLIMLLSRSAPSRNHPVRAGDLFEDDLFETIAVEETVDLDNHGRSLDWSTGEDLLKLAVDLAQKLGDQRAETYALGYLGYMSERAQQWAIAEAWTDQALVLAQSLQAEDMMYQWQWQLGRILRAQGDQARAIAAYSEAVKHLTTLRTDLLTTGTEGQFRFQEGVEPIYRELVDLLITPKANELISQANLEQARDVMEAFQIAELDNFFQEVCLEDESVQVDNVDTEAAVIYPIILRDRLDVIISLPQQPLQHFSTAIAEADLAQFIDDFRNNLVIRSRFDFRPQTQQLYDWLLRPAATLLNQNPIKTLVFVLDGPLRQIPMAVLHDGDRYLIEQYQVVVAPGLTLVNAGSFYRQPPRVLMAGLSQARHGFSPLTYVDVELEQISDTVSGSVLLDEAFTSQALERKIAAQPFPLVHIASHGQFSSQPENTFIIAWDKLLNIDELRQILQSGQRSSQTPIELLVLSACETATGDPRAPLGLAGMAVKAGARSILATQWSVNDGVTAQFMAQFYRYLDSGMSKAEALRQSQLWLLQFERFTHPLYWAPYVLIGNWD
ncbi:MAG: CHAT domain-containing protein [Cyanothece sp. SIO2G6]|nr:CHAT domain-containing protein [Cyanothece sp. SIO2G6]